VGGLTSTAVMTKMHRPVPFWPVVYNHTFRLKYIKNAKCACRAIILAMTEHNGISTQNHGDYFTFSFVRHPLSRLVSSYKDKILTGKLQGPNVSTEMTIDDCVSCLLSGDIRDEHFCPQSEILRLDELDFCGTLENIEEDWRVLMDKGLPPLGIWGHHKSGSAPWQEVLSKETEARAREYYAADFELWPGRWS